MTCRKTLICDSCGGKTITRTSVGYAERQHYAFPCPGCGIEISYVFETDAKTVSVNYTNLLNATWTDSEEGAIKVLSFNAEFPIPNDLPDRISPFVATALNISNFEKYSHEERLRREWLIKGWPYCERLLTHYEKHDRVLFDKVAGLAAGAELDDRARLELLGKAMEAGFYAFTLDRRPERARIRQRLALAQSISESLFTELAETYVSSGRMSAISKQVAAIRRFFTKIYPDLSVLLQIRYWEKNRQNLADYKLATKNFSELKVFLVDCFETLCKLLVIAAAVEGIIWRGKLVVPTKKADMPLWDFESMDNGNKHTILKNLPIGDLFLPALDAELRNGVGHHTAYYDAKTDEVVYYRFKGERQFEKRIGYTNFCDFCLRLFTAFELAAVCFQQLHVQAKGPCSEHTAAH
jgi:hypothetical protein